MQYILIKEINSIKKNSNYIYILVSNPGPAK